MPRRSRVTRRDSPNHTRNRRLPVDPREHPVPFGSLSFDTIECATGKGCLFLIDPERPAGIVERLDPYAVRVLPGTVALGEIPGGSSVSPKLIIDGEPIWADWRSGASADCGAVVCLQTSSCGAAL